MKRDISVYWSFFIIIKCKMRIESSVGDACLSGAHRILAVQQVIKQTKNWKICSRFGWRSSKICCLSVFLRLRWAQQLDCEHVSGESHSWILFSLCIMLLLVFLWWTIHSVLLPKESESSLWIPLYQKSKFWLISSLFEFNFRSF